MTSRDNAWLANRKAGLLLHISSLPGAGPCGDMGREAYRFVDFMSEAGFAVWQMLPVGPTGPDGSPYQSSSSHAGNPRFIALEPLAERGWIDPRDVGCGRVDDVAKRECLLWAYQGFKRDANEADRAAFTRFTESHAQWLDDFALFQALRDEWQCAWMDWPKALRDRQPQAIAEARARLSQPMDQIRFEQHIFFEQWHALRAYAEERGVELFGDLPIFVSQDSAEVWAHREFFHLDENGVPTVVAGVPPDYFSDTGQRWGNPLYRWDVLHAAGFSFWVDRLCTQLELFDLIRIDHFRGFEAYWEIPANEPDAVNGHWVKGPGDLLFKRLREVFGDLPLVAEDLGVITDEVRALRDGQGMPGMKILQFAFSGGPDNPYLIFNHQENAVVYTGTHDNDTTLGWYKALNDDERAVVDEYLGHSRDPMPWPLIHWAMLSTARLAVVPMQDLLGLNGEHRMNLPGSVEGNWTWRFRWEELVDDLAGQLRRVIWYSGRLHQ